MINQPRNLLQTTMIKNMCVHHNTGTEQERVSKRNRVRQKKGDGKKWEQTKIVLVKVACTIWAEIRIYTQINTLVIACEPYMAGTVLTLAPIVEESQKWPMMEIRQRPNSQNSVCLFVCVCVCDYRSIDTYNGCFFLYFCIPFGPDSCRCPLKKTRAKCAKMHLLRLYTDVARVFCQLCGRGRCTQNTKNINLILVELNCMRTSSMRESISLCGLCTTQRLWSDCDIASHREHITTMLNLH